MIAVLFHPCQNAFKCIFSYLYGSSTSHISNIMEGNGLTRPKLTNSFIAWVSDLRLFKLVQAIF